MVHRRQVSGGGDALRFVFRENVHSLLLSDLTPQWSFLVVEESSNKGRDSIARLNWIAAQTETLFTVRALSEAGI